MTGRSFMLFHVVAARATPGWVTVLATKGETQGAATVVAPIAMRSRVLPELFAPPRGASGAPSDGLSHRMHVTNDRIDLWRATNPVLLVGSAPQRGEHPSA
mmetsp:Transcript_10132/g.40982  ORF Transcript_10132/g.40982 Transcript_10132/m.40982 type:complete len:101 (+) Transcript_10132:759-1061(+)